MKPLLFFVLIALIIQLSIGDQSGMTIVSSSSGGASIGVQESTNQFSTNLQRFNQTDGYYRSTASRTAFLSTGTSGHTMSSTNNGNQNTNLSFKAASAGLISDSAALHEDNTNIPNTLCDTDTGLSQQSSGMINATNNTSYKLPGMVAMSEDAEINVIFSGYGTQDDIMAYQSDKNLEDSNISLEYDANAPGGNLFRISSSYIEAGNNRTNEIPQYSQYDRGHLVKSSDESGIWAREKITFTGYTYDGPNMPIAWKTSKSNTTNGTSNATFNQTVNLSVVTIPAT